MFINVLYGIVISLSASAINTCHISQEFTKTTISNYLQKIIEDCLASQTIDSQAEISLNCLEVCIKVYGSACGPYKNKIEKYLMKYLDADASQHLIKRAGRCYHFLQQVGGAGSEGVNHISNWNTQIKRLCRTMHIIYDNFLESFTEFNDYELIEAEAFEFEPILPTASKLSVLFVLTRRLRNLIQFLLAFIE